MTAFTAARFFSERKEDISDRFDKHACAVEDLPQQVSTLCSGENIMIKMVGVPAESHEQGSEAYGQLVFWTTYALMDQAWHILQSQFLSGRPQEAVAIAARKQKPDWYIEESRRPFGDCRLTVFIPTSDQTHQSQVAGEVAEMLGKVNISHIFYISNTQVMQTASVPAAARLTQPVYESPNHQLVYVQPLTQQHRTLSPEGSWLSSATNHSVMSSNSSRSNASQGYRSGSNAANSDSWHRSGANNAAPNSRTATNRWGSPPGSSKGADSASGSCNFVLRILQTCSAPRVVLETLGSIEAPDEVGCVVEDLHFFNGILSESKTACALIRYLTTYTRA